MWKLIVTVIATAILFVPGQPAKACGDKLLSMARGVRLFSAYTAWRSASIVVYEVRNAGENTVKESQFQLSLREAGHRVKTVRDANEFEEVVRSEQVDLILADMGDASTLAKRMERLRSKALLLPVVYKPSKGEWTAAKEQFSFVLKAPARSTQHLKTIDQAMKARVQAVTRM